MEISIIEVILLIIMLVIYIIGMIFISMQFASRAYATGRMDLLIELCREGIIEFPTLDRAFTRERRLDLKLRFYAWGREMIGF